MSLFEGQNLNGRAINVELGPDKGGMLRARWDMEVVDGPHKGKIAKYSGKLPKGQPDIVKWTTRDMKAIGWKSGKSATFVDEVKAANLVVSFNAEIASYNGNEWVSAKFSGAAPLGTLDSDTTRELDRMFAEVGDDGPSNGNPDVPF